MKHARLFAVFTVAALALALRPGAGAAQVHYGAHLSWADSYPPGGGGTFGLGARVGYDLGVLPVSVWGHGDYYFPEDVQGTDTGYLTAGLDAHYSPIDLGPTAPYILAGGMLRRTSANDVSTTSYGYVAGLGVEVEIFLTSSLQIRREFFDDLDGGSQWTVRLGVVF